MKIANYNRSKGLYFYEIDLNDQKEIISNYDWMSIDELESTLFFTDSKGRYFCAADFIRNEGYFSRKFHGYYFDGYFSAYLITLSKDGENAIISYSYSL